MFDSIKRLQLQRKGYSCGKTRRTQGSHPLLEILARSPWIKMLIFVGFFLLMVALVSFSRPPGVIFEGSPMGVPLQAIGVLAVLYVVALFQFFANHPNSFQRNSRIVLIFGLIVCQLLVLKGLCFLVHGNGMAESYIFLLLPYALAPVALSVLLGRTQGLFAVLSIGLWGCLLVPGPYVFSYLLMVLVCGFVGVYVTNQVRRRSRLVRAGFSVGLIGLLMTCLLGLVDIPPLAEFGSRAWKSAGTQMGIVVLVGVVTVMLVSGTLPMLESLFSITTDISWIELADLNHPLLKKMTIEAPGTYHHSLVVANLAESAAEAIGANATMSRVCSYFHDIGKLVKPQYYIENISEDDNPHDDLTPTMSALIILAHVKDGVDMALNNKLKSEIIDVIEQHHGNSLVYFFYRRALDQQKEFKERVEAGKESGEDIPEVREESFRYPGPKPQFKESAIISLADALESASRSLAKPTPQKIEQLIEDITQARIRDGQLDECNLTFQELELVKKSFFRTLRSMLHSRISYPKDDEDPTAEMDRQLEREKTKTQKIKKPPRQQGKKVARTLG